MSCSVRSTFKGLIIGWVSCSLQTIYRFFFSTYFCKKAKQNCNLWIVKTWQLVQHNSLVDSAKQLNSSHRLLKHLQHQNLQKTREAIAIIVIITAIQPLQAQPSPTLPPPSSTAAALPWSVLTQSSQRGVPCAVRPTVDREVHHSQDTRSTHKTQSRKEESRDKGRDWTHSRHQRRVITANAVSCSAGSEENDRWKSLLMGAVVCFYVL